ncbi:MAG: hypothetical protein U0892_07170 [Pirellulales bacterium]
MMHDPQGESSETPSTGHFPGLPGAGKNIKHDTCRYDLQKGDWKLMEFLKTGDGIYNLRDDIGETKNLVQSETEESRRVACSDESMARIDPRSDADQE